MPGWNSDTSTGLLNWYVGTIEESFAGTNAQYQDGTVTRLTWETSVDDVLQEDYEGEVPPSITRNITLGTGWETDDDGILYHEDDEERADRGLDPKDFKSSSFYGNLIALIAGQTDDWNGKYTVVDHEDEELEIDLKGVMAYFDANGYDDPRDPKVWVGLTFEFRTLEFEGGRNMDNYFRTVPTKLVSTPDTKQKPKRATKKATAVSADIEPFDFEAHGADKVLSDKLNGLLQSAKTQSEFVQKALQIDGVGGNDALMTVLVSDEGPWSNRA